MSDVKQAAERLRARSDQPYEMGGKDSYYLHSQYVDDLCLIADAYLREHPADDAEPIDEAWLRAVGQPSTLSEKVYGYNFAGQGINLNVSMDYARTRWMAELTQDEDTIALGQIKTRHDLRLLCRALGITLSENQ